MRKEKLVSEYTDKDIRNVVEVYYKAGANKAVASIELGIHKETLWKLLRIAKDKGYCVSYENEIYLSDHIKNLQAQLKEAAKNTLSVDLVKKEILNFTTDRPEIPQWTINHPKGTGHPGVPTVFISDFHYSEVVDPAQVNGINEYNIDIAERRFRNLVEKTIRILKHYMVNPEYPGIVFPFGGDIFSGDIHDELVETNEIPTLQAFIKIQGLIIWGIKEFKREFGKVYCPWIVGNHGRTTKKPPSKNACYTNLDWLLGKQIEKYFENDKAVVISVADSLDYLYSIYNVSYLLTHGDQFKGGAGISGALAPLMIGDSRKKKRHDAIQQPYNYMICGHWHQYATFRRIIINGSVKGYDEYAYKMNFDYEPPTQAMWLTHKDRGKTIDWPIILEEPKSKANANDWVSWSKYKEQSEIVKKVNNHLKG